MKHLFTKLSIIIVFQLFLISSQLFSQTIDVYPRSNFSVNDTFKISFTVDSLLNTYSLDEIFTSEKRIVLEIQNSSVKVLSPDSINYLNENHLEITERVKTSLNGIFLELTQTENENVFFYNSHKTLSEFVGLRDNEFLNGMELGWNSLNWWTYWGIHPDEVYERLSTNSNSILIDGGNINISPFDNLTKDKSEVFTLSKTIKSNLNFLIEENTDDLLLEKDSNGETVFSQNIGLRNPIVEDFNGDGIDDIVSQIYQYFVGDVSIILTDEEKEKLVSRWGVFLGSNSNTDSLVYEMGFLYDEKSEGSNFKVIDIDNDGFLDILSRPEWYHGLDENKPDYYRNEWLRPSMVYINNGEGTFSVDSIYPSGKRTYPIQLDNDKNYEFIHYGLGHDEDIRTWEYNEDGVSNVKYYSTDYQYVNDFKNYDINNDGFQDVIVLSSDVNVGSVTITISCFYGGENGVDLEKNKNEILYQFDEFSNVHLDDYPMSIDTFNEGTDLIVIWLLNSEYNSYYEDKGDFKTILRGFEIRGGQLLEVTEDVFPDNLFLNKINPPNPPLWGDVDGDGLTDLYFNRETWFKETDPISISYFKNNGTYFEPRYFSTFDISSGGFPSDVHLLDINSDGSFEMIFDSYPWFELNENKDITLCVYPFEVIYNNESPTEINLSKTSIVENSEEGTEIGLLTSMDSDTTDSHTFYLVSGDGDSGNQYFTIKDNKLLSTVMFDYESQNSYSIRIQTEDGKGGMFSKSFTIGITNDVEVGVQNLFDSDEIKIYPNPVTDRIIIEQTNSTQLQMIINDGLGNKVLEQTVQNQSNEVYVNNLVGGLYILNLVDGNTVTHTQKFIKY